MAISIVILNADIKRGEKVLSAYILSSIRFDCCCCCRWWVGSARLFSLCSSVVNRNEWVATSSRYGCTIGAKKKGVKFFFKFFFRGVVGPWVWARGCGPVGCVGCGCVGCGGDGGGLDRAG